MFVFLLDFLLLYLLWLDESWLSSMRIFAAASRVTVWVLDTRNSMTNFWLMMRKDLSFLLPAAVNNKGTRSMSDYYNHRNLLYIVYKVNFNSIIFSKPVATFITLWMTSLSLVLLLSNHITKSTHPLFMKSCVCVHEEVGSLWRPGLYSFMRV